MFYSVACTSDGTATSHETATPLHGLFESMCKLVISRS
jgi:hypothetical protein